MSKGFIAGGCGTPLNFKVVGGMTEPANPRENTIWVKTEDKISAWAFSNTPPVEQEGLVWIETSIRSATSFNALKKNTLRVYPQRCTQYIHGLWVGKDFEVFIGGTWTSSVFNLLVDGKGRGFKHTSGSLVQYDGYIYATKSDTTMGYFYYPDPIDLTGFSTYTFDGSFSHYQGWGDNASRGIYVGKTPTSAASTVGLAVGRGTYNMDISALEGEYYVGFYTAAWYHSGLGYSSVSYIAAYNMSLSP